MKFIRNIILIPAALATSCASFQPLGLGGWSSVSVSSPITDEPEPSCVLRVLDESEFTFDPREGGHSLGETTRMSDINAKWQLNNKWQSRYDYPMDVLWNPARRDDGPRKLVTTALYTGSREKKLDILLAEMLADVQGEILYECLGTNLNKVGIEFHPKKLKRQFPQFVE